LAKNKTPSILLALILVTGSYLRLHNLGAPSFWADELDFVVAAQSMKEVGEPLLHSGYAYPRAPLLTYAVMFSTALFGTSEFASRLPAAVFGIIAIAMTFWIGKRWFNTRVGLVAALLLAISPFAVGWSRTCRMYSLFQLLFLAGLYFFYNGFEWRQGSVDSTQTTEGDSLFSKLQRWLQDQGVNVPYLFFGTIVLLFSYTSHQNAGLFFLSFLGYLLLYGLYDWAKVGLRQAVKNKYLLLSAVVFVVSTLAYLAVPFLREFVNDSVLYQPKWAEVATAQDRWRIVDFFFGQQKFPFDWLFVFGALLMLLRNEKAGVYSLFAFVVPVLMFSVVFQYRKNDYIFHVYPLFYLIAAYGLDHLVALGGRVLDRLRSKRLLGEMLTGSNARSLLYAACLLWIPLTFNFRFSQKVPRLQDGHFNGAVYFNEWKELADFLKDQVGENEVLVSTLPLTIKHYLGRADFNLNWSNADLAAKNGNHAPDGRLVDFYSGADVIEDLDELRKVFRDNPTGWLLVDNYRFANSVYVPDEIRTYLATRVQRVFESKNKTVSAYQWTEKAYTSGTN
jgi:4-amino-4-deoxy-L-arabinose transferase-like glycosyltransferase